MDPQAAGHAPRIDVEGPDKVSADIALDPAIIAALAEDAPVETARRGVMPGNFPNPSLILQCPYGLRIGMSHDRSPWSVALAQ